MTNQLSRLIVLLLFGLPAVLSAAIESPPATTNVTVSPMPDWVRLRDWTMPRDATTAAKSEGSRYLLFERQDHVKRGASFTRSVLLMLNEVGVQDSGSLTVGFDPSFQHLTLHRVEIHRGDAVLNRLNQAKLRVIQPEPGLEEHVFTGRQKAVLFIEDLRVGDILEYAYTLQGANPILAGHYATRFTVQSGVAVDRQRFRVVWPAAKPMFRRQHLVDAPPRTNPAESDTEHLWDFARKEAIAYEDHTPGTYEPYPYIELSDFSDWSQVVKWALPLYSSRKGELPTDLFTLVAKWRGDAASDEERARMALDFVQDELRYTGIELGTGSHRPTPPSETFRLRYGDCKAKALLLCAILNEMAIEAYPALVSTYAGEGISVRLPSLLAFDHVVVKLNLDGKPVWVDPTRSQQGGSLFERPLARFGKALVVRKGSSNLEDVPPCSAQALQRVTSTFEFKDYQSPATFTVKTQCYGPEAERVRGYLARSDHREIAKAYLNYYARYYPGVSELRPFEVQDNRLSNSLELTEYYEVTNLWVLNQTNQNREACFWADSLNHLMPEPTIRLRKMPMEMPYPLHREQRILVHLPDTNWDIPTSEGTVACAPFTFHHQRKGSGSLVEFAYECETKTNQLSPDTIPMYLEKVDEMENSLGEVLYRPGEGRRRGLADTNWLMVVVAGFGASATLGGGIWVWRTTRPHGGLTATDSAPPVLGESEPRGLGGWLILVGFGLLWSLLHSIRCIAQDWAGCFSAAAWQTVALPGGSSYHPLYGPLLIFENLANILQIGLIVLALGLFFARRRLFPTVYIILQLTSLSLNLVAVLVASRIPSLAPDYPFAGVVRMAISAAIWTAYMVRSSRVQTTFVN